MPYMYSEMQNKLSKTRESPLESMGQIISSRCPIVAAQVSSPWEVLLDKLIFLSFFPYPSTINVKKETCILSENSN